MFNEEKFTFYVVIFDNLHIFFLKYVLQSHKKFQKIFSKKKNSHKNLCGFMTEL